jgi:hypothetical protein
MRFVGPPHYPPPKTSRQLVRIGGMDDIAAKAIRIELAVKTGVAYAAGDVRPFKQVADFILALKSSPEWTVDDLVEVQAKIIEGLGKARHDQE